MCSTQHRMVLMHGSAFALAGALVTAAGAQSVVIPPGAQPGAIERQFQTLPEPRVRPGSVELPRVQQRAPAGAELVRFDVKRIEVDGATALPQDQLRVLLTPLEGREVSLAELIALANRLTATYRNEGYILAQVVVPEQRIEPRDAVVHLQAIEGFVDAVRFRGDAGVDAARLDAVAQAIRAARPLTASTLERYLLLLNDIPGLRAATTLSPSLTQPGAADLEIRLSRSALGGEIAIDNRGSRAIGPWRAAADIEAFGLTGPSRTAAKLVSTGNQQLLFGHVQHEQTLNGEGTKLVMSAAYARSRPDLAAALGSTTLETASNSWSLSIQHPVVRSRTENLYLRAALTSYNGETLTNATLTGRDRVRALRLGMTYDRADAYQGLNVLDLELSQGLPRYGASSQDDPNRSRANGRAEFTKGTLYAARLQSVARRWSLLLAGSAQYAGSSLLAPELFAVGGEQFGRGYDASELMGDHGAAMKLELRYTDASETDRVPTYTLYSFYDVGVVRRRAPLGEPAQSSLASAGFGLRLAFDRGVSGFIEIAQPLTRQVTSRGNREARPYAGVAAKF